MSVVFLQSTHLVSVTLLISCWKLQPSSPRRPRSLLSPLPFHLPLSHSLTPPFWFFSSPNQFLLHRHLSGSGHGRFFLQTNPNMPFPASCFPDLFAGLCVLLRRFPSEPSGGPHAVVLGLFCSFLFTLHFLSPSLPAKDESPSLLPSML